MKLKAVLLSALPTALIFGLFGSSALAVTTNVKATDDLAGVIRSAHSGDVIQVGAGTFNLNAPIIVPSNVIISGASVDATHVVFNLAGGNDTSYAFVISGNAQNVAITQLDIVSNHGAIGMGAGSGYKNIVITTFEPLAC